MDADLTQQSADLEEDAAIARFRPPLSPAAEAILRRAGDNIERGMGRFDERLRAVFGDGGTVRSCEDWFRRKPADGGGAEWPE